MGDIGAVDEDLVMDFTGWLPDRFGCPAPGVVAVPGPDGCGEVAAGAGVGDVVDELAELCQALLVCAWCGEGVTAFGAVPALCACSCGAFLSTRAVADRAGTGTRAEFLHPMHITVASSRKQSY